MGSGHSHELSKRSRLKFVRSWLMQLDVFEKRQWEEVIIHYLHEIFQRKKQPLPKEKKKSKEKKRKDVWLQARQEGNKITFELCGMAVLMMLFQVKWGYMSEKIQMVLWLRRLSEGCSGQWFTGPVVGQKIKKKGKEKEIPPNFAALERTIYVWVCLYIPIWGKCLENQYAHSAENSCYFLKTQSLKLAI